MPHILPIAKFLFNALIELMKKYKNDGYKGCCGNMRHLCYSMKEKITQGGKGAGGMKWEIRCIIHC